MFTLIKQPKDNDNFLASSMGHLKASKFPRFGNQAGDAPENDAKEKSNSSFFSTRL